MSYRSVSTRKVSPVDVIGNSRLERVMEVGKLLRGLQLRGDLVATGPPVSQIRKLEQDTGSERSKMKRKRAEVSEQLISDMLMSEDLLSFLKMKNFVLANKHLNQSYKDSLGWEPVKSFLLDLLDNEIECAKFVLNCYIVRFWDNQHETDNMKQNVQLHFIFLLNETVKYAKYFPMGSIKKEAKFNKVELDAIHQLNLEQMKDADIIEMAAKLIFSYNDVIQMATIYTEYRMRLPPFTISESVITLQVDPSTDLDLDEDNELSNKLFMVAGHTGSLNQISTLSILNTTKNGYCVKTLTEHINARKLTPLRELCITKIPLGDCVYAGELFSSLSLLPNLKRLVLDGIQIFIKEDALWPPKLKVLCLNNNNFDGMKHLSNTIATGKLSELQYLDLEKNNIGDTGMSWLSGAIKRNGMQSLQSLNLNECMIGDDGMVDLSIAIESDDTPLDLLVSLNLQGNTGIRQRGINRFSDALIKGSLVDLRILLVDEYWKENTALNAVCENRMIDLG